MNKKNLYASIVMVVIIIIIALLGITGKLQKKENKYTATFLEVFDTRTELVGYAKTQDEFEKNADLIKEKLVHYNQLYDIYNSYEGINNVKTINENAGIEPVVVDKDIIDLIKFSKDMYYATKGKTNIAMGSVLSIWHEYRDRGITNPEEASLPEEDVLKEAALHTDIEDVIIDEEASTVYLADPDMSLDVGSIGKGYAVERIAEYAKELGNDNMLISVGGNISALGTHNDGSPWKLGVQNPDLTSEETSIVKVTVEDRECIVSSGDYQRYYMVDGRKYCHIINPDTLYPSDYFAGVTIITKDSGKADAYSTALFNMTVEEGMEFVNSQDELEAIWIKSDGSITMTGGFEKYIAN